MELKDLVGYQVVNIDNEQMTVSKDGKSYTINFKCDYGDCCGYSDITNTLLFNPQSPKENPVIIRVESSDTESENGDEASIRITLFGEYKPLAKIEANAGSGSGWCYGATVTAICKSLNLDETIIMW